MLALKREEADALLPTLGPVNGHAPVRYDALLDQYEPGARVKEIAVVLTELRAQLVPLVRELLDRGKAPSDELLQREYPRAAQEAFGKRIASQFGFDFERGRLDVTAHPFCSEMGPHDKRMTTRYNEHAFNEAFFASCTRQGTRCMSKAAPRMVRPRAGAVSIARCARVAVSALGKSGRPQPRVLGIRFAPRTRSFSSHTRGYHRQRVLSRA